MAALGTVTSNPFYGKKLAALGTSITANSTFGLIPSLATKLGFGTVYNLGVSGAQLSGGLANDLIHYGAAGIWYELGSIPADADVVTVECGVNDFRSSIKVGNPTDVDLTSFYGALFKALTWLRTYRPNALVYILTPYSFTDTSGGVGNWQNPNGWNRWLREYQAAIHYVAANFSVPVIKMGEEGGVHGGNASSYLSDGLHVNAAGAQVIAGYVAKWMLNLFPGWPPVVTPPTLVAPATWGANLQTNPSFETNTTGWFVNSSGTLVRDTTYHLTDFAGSNVASGQFTPNGTTNNPGVQATPNNVTPGTIYKSHLSMRLLPSTGGPQSWPLSMTTYCVDGTSTQTLLITQAKTCPVGEWVEFEQEFTAPANTVTATIYGRCGGAPSPIQPPMTSVVFNIDDCRFQARAN